jgi:predicted DNA-binding transcriptional regulator AlpA
MDKQDSSAIPDALKNFDTLPDAANVRDKVVAGLFGCSVPTVWRMSADGRLPRPRKLSTRVTAWNCGELRKVLRAAGEREAV